ncbi:ABC transporter substrate-binding protein [Actinophytocola sp.]|uniref:ABC transporter substrate-binding protein n=1 Tax=Actinophytocola sp. TaxID=1872138 RepID=UPI002ED99FF1
MTQAHPLRALMIAAVLLVSACAGVDTAQGGTGDRILNLGNSIPPTSLDPGNATGNAWYAELAYDSLIHQAPDGKLAPRLATAWRYVGTGNTVFELDIRDGVTFSDGSPLTAEVVRANLERYRKATDLAATAQLAGVTKIEVPKPGTVRLTLAKADPMLPEKLTPFYAAGNMVSQAGLDDPAKLAEQTLGAGPYVLDPAETVDGDHYTYTPNKRYWDKQAVHYDRVVIKVLPNPNTALAALKTGQVEVIFGSPATDTAAKSAGLRVVSVPQTWVGIALADRGGAVSKPLADVRVRQALNYAVDREKIAKGLVGTYGGPAATEQIQLPHQDGHSDHTFYAYDPAKAKRLLRDAGYAKGFPLPVVSNAGATPLLQAMAGDLKAVGVDLKITDRAANQDKYAQDLGSGQFPAFGITFGALPVHLMGPLLFLPENAFFNPFRTADARIQSLYQQAAAAGPEDRARLDEEIVARIAEQAWFVPVLFQPVSFYARQGVTGLEVTTGNPNPNPVEWSPA